MCEIYKLTQAFYYLFTGKEGLFFISYNPIDVDSKLYFI